MPALGCIKGFNSLGYGSFRNDKFGAWNVWGDNKYGDIMGWKGTSYSSYTNKDFITVGNSRSLNNKRTGVLEWFASLFKNSRDTYHHGTTMQEALAENPNISTMEVQNVKGDEQISMQRIRYSATPVFGGGSATRSTIHTPPPTDTVIQRKDAYLIYIMNTRDSLRAMERRNSLNSN